MGSHVAYVGQKFARNAVLGALCLSSVGCGSEAVTPQRSENVQVVREPSVVAPGFQENQLLQGHVNPVGIRFVKAPGPLRAVVFEKGGKVYYYDDLAAQSTPLQAKLVADVSSSTHNFWDRGLLGLALDPSFPAVPNLYILSTIDPGNFLNDGCTDATGAGCVVNGRLSRLVLDMANPSVASTVEQPLLEAKWCMQYPSHATGDLQFGSDGYLYASSGDGASFNFVDWGQVDGLLNGVLTKNVCNDPGGLDAQGRLLLATSEGGQLRSQDVQSGGDATGYNGTILRMDVSGALPVAPATNPLVGKGSTSDDLIIATGLRNPYRFNIRPGTSEVWIADVGEGQVEELNRIQDPSGTLENFGWPCFEGNIPRFSGNATCDQVKSGTFAPSVSPQALAAPFFSYRHDEHAAPGDGCNIGGSSITGVAFNDKHTYPAQYDGALFFADSTRQCVWSMRQGSGGQPDPATRAVLVQGAAGRVVDIQMASDGRLYYVDFDGGKVFRIDNFVGNQPPQAVVTATPSDGPAPLTVQFSAAQSTDAEGNPLTFSWDMDGDGIYDDAQGVTPQYTFDSVGIVVVSVLAVDTSNDSDSASVTISVGNSAPVPSITAPVLPFTWANADTISFTGGASDAEDGALVGDSLAWQLVVRHCHEEPRPGEPEDCHDHVVQTFAGTTGSFVAPDHAYYSYLELRLTATDSNGLSASSKVRLEPRPVELSIDSVPPGIAVTVGEHEAQTTPTGPVKVLQNGQTTVQVESPQVIGGRSYAFVSWSNGGAQIQTLTPSSNQNLSVLFQDVGPAPVCVSNPLAVVGSAASSSEGPDLAPAEAFDGINDGVCGGANRWSSQFADPQWIYADLGGSRHLSEVVLHWECAHASDFEVQVAPDGADPTSSAAYTTVLTNAASAGGTQVIGGLNVVGRYVRIYSRARATQWGNSLFEVEIKGDLQPGCTVATLPGRSIAEKLEAETHDGMLGVQYEATTDTGAGQNAGFIDANDYVEWRIEVPTTRSYTLTTRSATWAAAGLTVLVDGAARVGLALPSTWPGTGAQFQTWQSFVTPAFELTAGTHTLRVAFTSGNQNLNWVKVDAVLPAVCGNGVLEAGEACDDGNNVNADSCTNGCALPTCGDAICSTVETCTTCAADCAPCSGRDIANNLEAETHDGMLGLQYEPTSDTGGGQNAGWIANGDYVQWVLNVPATGLYTVTTRSATWAAAGVQVLLDGALTTSLNLPSTWPGSGPQFQTWASFTTPPFNMTAGSHTLRVVFTSGSQNLNFVKVNLAPPNLLTNGSFSSNLGSWLSYFMAPAGTATFDAGTARITPASGGTDWWAQLFQSTTVLAGSYKLTANAQTLAGTKTIALFCEQDGGAFTNYGQATCNITTTWNTGAGCAVTCNNVPAGMPIKFGVKGGLTSSAFRVDNFVLTKL